MYNSIDRRLENIEKAIRTQTSNYEEPYQLARLTDKELLEELKIAVSIVPPDDPVAAKLSEAIAVFERTIQNEE
jgi:hypothetical protein